MTGKKQFSWKEFGNKKIKYIINLAINLVISLLVLFFILTKIFKLFFDIN